MAHDNKWEVQRHFFEAGQSAFSQAEEKDGFRSPFNDTAFAAWHTCFEQHPPSDYKQDSLLWFLSGWVEAARAEK